MLLETAFPFQCRMGAINERQLIEVYADVFPQTHSCFQKACLIQGLQHVRILPTTAAADWALQPEVLEAAVQQDIEAGLIPFYAVATVGTTSSCAVDPLDRIAAVTNW